MKAIVKIGSKQYFVKENDEIFVELLPQEEGTKVTLDEVLSLDGKVGTPYVKGAKVTAKVLKNGKQKKIKVFKYKPKNNDKVTKGHRQPYTKLLIEKIEG